MDWRLIVALAGAFATIVSAYVAWKWDRQNLQESPLSIDAFSPEDSRVPDSPVFPQPEEPLLPEAADAQEESLSPDVPQTDFGNLSSDVDADYTRLRDLLAAENYKAADRETRKVMVWVCRAVKQAERYPQDSLPFPCNDLKTIDQLWVHYSEGRFGFSVQKGIYTAVERDYEQFGDRVGWRKKGEWLNYHHLQFDRNAPQGHLPRITWVLVGGYEGWKPASLAKRCFDCQI
jgi:GUN4-like